MPISRSGIVYQYKETKQKRRTYVHFICNIVGLSLLIYTLFFVEMPTRHTPSVVAATIPTSTPFPTPTITPIITPLITQSPATRVLSMPIQKQQIEQDNNSHDFLWPVHGTVLTYFSVSHPGIDIGGSLSTIIHASKSGIVEVAKCGYNDGYGCYVIINHDNGDKTLYAHLSTLFVQSGNQVASGSDLGMMGSTGNATAVHLHFAILHLGSFINPLSHL